MWSAAREQVANVSLRAATSRQALVSFDEEIARLQLEKIGVKLTKLTKKQADHLGVPLDGAISAGALR